LLKWFACFNDEGKRRLLLGGSWWPASGCSRPVARP
jgi:hypothetical protein